MTKEYGDIQLGNSAEWRSVGQNQLSQMLWKYLKERSERPNFNGEIRKQVERLKEKNAVEDKHAFNISIGDNLDTVPFTAFEVHKALKDKVFSKRLFEKNLQRTPTNEEIERFHRRLKDVTKIEEKELTLERLVKAQNDVFEEARNKGLVRKEEEVPGVVNEYIDYEDPQGRALLEKQKKYENDILNLEGNLKKLDPQRFFKRKETYSRDIGEIENNKNQVLSPLRSQASLEEDEDKKLEQYTLGLMSDISLREKQQEQLSKEKTALLHEIKNYESKIQEASHRRQQLVKNIDPKEVEQRLQENAALMNSLYYQNSYNTIKDHSNGYRIWYNNGAWQKLNESQHPHAVAVRKQEELKKELINAKKGATTVDTQAQSVIDNAIHSYKNTISDLKSKLDITIPEQERVIEKDLQLKSGQLKEATFNKEKIKEKLIKTFDLIKQKQDFFDKDLNAKKREYDEAEHADRFEEERLKEKVNEYKTEKNKIWQEAHRLGFIAKNKNTKKADYIKEDTQEGKDLAK